MIIAGRRVSREALCGDPGFVGTGLLRVANRPVLPTRNSITAVATVAGGPAGALVRSGSRGFLSKLGGLAGVGIGALTGGPFGAALALGPALSRRLPTPGGVGFPGVPGLMAGFGALGPTFGRGRAPFGGRMTKRGGFTMRRRPRMRVTNTRPLLRAIRRVRGAERVFRGIFHIARAVRRHPHIRRRRSGARTRTRA